MRHGPSAADGELPLQHEVGKRNLEILNATTDARGRKLEVVKVHCPPPLFRTYKEAEGVHVSLPASATTCRDLHIARQNPRSLGMHACARHSHV